MLVSRENIQTKSIFNQADACDGSSTAALWCLLIIQLETFIAFLNVQIFSSECKVRLA